MAPSFMHLGDNGAFLCIPMKIGAKSEHWRGQVNPLNSPN
jgi:hypothetical protein